MLVQLSNKQQWFLDCTFKIASQGFKQLLNIIVYNPKFKLYYPACYILLSHKTEEIYYMALECLKQITSSLNIELKPSVVMTDFEKALRNALSKSFPKAKLSGCYFHFTKCLWEKCSKLGLRTKDFKQKSRLLISFSKLLLIAL